MISFIKKHKKISLAAVLILAVAGYFVFRPSDKNEAVAVYTYGTVQSGTVMQTVSGTGQISSARESALKSKVSGKVASVAVSPGQAVKSGDIIASLDDRDAQAAVEEARLALENARISMEELYEPADELVLTQAQNALNQAEESLKNDQEDLKKAYEDGFDAVVDAFGNLPSIIAGMQDIVAGSSSYVVQSNAGYLDYYSDAIKNYDPQASQMAAAASSSFRSAKARYDENFADYKSMSRSADNEDVETLIGQNPRYYPNNRRGAEKHRHFDPTLQGCAQQPESDGAELCRHSLDRAGGLYGQEQFPFKQFGIRKKRH